MDWISIVDLKHSLAISFQFYRTGCNRVTPSRLRGRGRRISTNDGRLRVIESRCEAGETNRMTSSVKPCRTRLWNTVKSRTGALLWQTTEQTEFRSPRRMNHVAVTHEHENATTHLTQTTRPKKNHEKLTSQQKKQKPSYKNRANIWNQPRHR